VPFRPEEKNDSAWKGEAVIDGDEFLAITIFTKLARRVPFWVRTAPEKSAN